MKRCSTCLEEKNESEFNVDKQKADGLQSRCRSCWKAWREERSERLAARQRDYVSRNRSEVYKRNKAWRDSNPMKVKAQKRRYYDEHGDEIKRKESERRTRDPRYRLEKNIQTSMSRALNGAKAGRSWESLVGYSLDALIAHLESMFEPGMTWENYGKNGWHVDHVVPKSWFEYEAPEDEQFKSCWALSNLQPLWSEDNFAKGCHYSGRRVED